MPCLILLLSNPGLTPQDCLLSLLRNCMVGKPVICYVILQLLYKVEGIIMTVCSSHVRMVQWTYCIWLLVSGSFSSSTLLQYSVLLEDGRGNHCTMG